MIRESLEIWLFFYNVLFSTLEIDGKALFLSYDDKPIMTRDVHFFQGQTN